MSNGHVKQGARLEAFNRCSAYETGNRHRFEKQCVRLRISSRRNLSMRSLLVDPSLYLPP